MASRTFFGSITVTDCGPCILMRMHGGNKNLSVFNPEFFQAFLDALDYVESFDKERCLMLTGTGKYFSAGLDTKFMTNKDQVTELAKWGTKLYLKLLQLNMPTVAAINGNTYGVGLFIALCCDYRIMALDCGHLWLPNATVGLPHGIGWPEGWRDVLKLKILPETLLEVVRFEKKYSSAEALKIDLVDFEIGIDATKDSDEFVRHCVGWAQRHTKFATTREDFPALKYELYYIAIDSMNVNKTEPTPVKIKAKL
eukprot:716802_1